MNDVVFHDEYLWEYAYLDQFLGDDWTDGAQHHSLTKCLINILDVTTADQVA